MTGAFRWLRTAPAAFALAAAGAALAQPIVIHSSGPSAALFPPGRSIEKAVVVVLKPGDQLTLLDDRGTRVIRGPGTFTMGQAATTIGVGVRLDAIWSAGAARARIGAVRGVPGPRAGTPNIWLLDSGKDGDVCVADPARLWLWRPGGPAATLTIRSGQGDSATATWPEEAETLAWPASLPVRAGESYTIDLDGAAHSVRIVAAGLAPASLEETAQTLARAGCDNQVDALANAVTMADMEQP